jgi:methylenetetrahydrofolate reductase (NADPH)
LRDGEFVVTAEITPPVSTDPADFVARAMPLKGVATAVNVTDGAGAKAHLSSLVAAHYLLQAGIEPILQITCRDRNRLAIQGDILGAASLGIGNFLMLAGDNPKAGDQPDAKAVNDLDSRTLIAMANGMRKERKLPPGTEIKGALELTIGAADMPLDPPPDWQPKSLLPKVEAGADFAQTQFCMDVEVARRYARRLLDLGIAQRLPILVGVSPIPSAKSARWMKEKLFGTIIPDSIVTRLEQASDAKAEGNRICVELLQQLAEIPGIGGAHVMAPMNFSAIPVAIERSGVLKKKRKTA